MEKKTLVLVSFPFALKKHSDKSNLKRERVYSGSGLKGKHIMVGSEGGGGLEAAGCITSRIREQKGMKAFLVLGSLSLLM